MDRLILNGGFMRILLAMCLFLTGCAEKFGWQVNFGVHPVNAVYDQGSLNKQEITGYGREEGFSTLAKR